MYVNLNTNKSMVYELLMIRQGKDAWRVSIMYVCAPLYTHLEFNNFFFLFLLLGIILQVLLISAYICYVYLQVLHFAIIILKVVLNCYYAVRLIMLQLLLLIFFSSSSSTRIWDLYLFFFIILNSWMRVQIFKYTS